jgi:hypothetical protein
MPHKRKPRGTKQFKVVKPTVTTSYLQQLFKKPRENKSTTTYSLKSLFEFAPGLALLLLSMLSKTKAEQIYALDPKTNTPYSMIYNTSDFPALRSTLIDVCKAIIFDAPQTNYTFNDTAQCVSPIV